MLATMLNLIDKGTISGKIAKTLFSEMFETGKDPEKIVQEKGLVQIADSSELEQIIAQVLSQNDKSVQDYKGGKTNAFGFLIGQIMKATQGKANPKMVNELLTEKLK